MTIRRAYIDRAAIAQPQLRFTWDEWNIKSTYLPVNEDEAVRLQKLSKRANCALTIGPTGG